MAQGENKGLGSQAIEAGRRGTLGILAAVNDRMKGQVWNYLAISRLLIGVGDV